MIGCWLWEQAILAWFEASRLRWVEFGPLRR
jgi:hypothetical protein